MTVLNKHNNSTINTSPASLNTGAVSAATASVASRDFWQTRDFASITDATTLILKKIDFPLKRRNFICALQGIANGRDEFKCAHLTIARRLGNKAKPGRLPPQNFTASRNFRLAARYTRELFCLSSIPIEKRQLDVQRLERTSR
jgi:hypothetical protein